VASDREGGAEAPHSMYAAVGLTEIFVVRDCDAAGLWVCVKTVDDEF
jgi:hypothetical protein